MSFDEISAIIASTALPPALQGYSYNQNKNEYKSTINTYNEEIERQTAKIYDCGRYGTRDRDWDDEYQRGGEWKEYKWTPAYVAKAFNKACRDQSDEWTIFTAPLLCGLRKLPCVSNKKLYR
eukprot:11842_1